MGGGVMCCAGAGEHRGDDQPDQPVAVRLLRADKQRHAGASPCSHDWVRRSAQPMLLLWVPRLLQACGSSDRPQAGLSTLGAVKHMLPPASRFHVTSPRAHAPHACGHASS